MSGWIKRLRRKLRNRKPALLLASIMLLLLLTVSLTWYAVKETNLSEQNDVAQVVIAPQKWQVVIQKIYLAGPSVEEKQDFSEVQLKEFIATSTDMKMVEEGEGKLVFEQIVADISPTLKEKGRFALDQNGMLTLYEGEVKEENIIQTFFQIDLERLETTLPVEEYMQLREGIHFTSLAEYNSILSTYSEYAVLDVEEHEPQEH